LPYPANFFFGKKKKKEKKLDFLIPPLCTPNRQSRNRRLGFSVSHPTLAMRP